MTNSKRLILSLLSTLLLLPPLLADNATISVVVPAKKAPLRDAHFNWQFTSANGASVRSGTFACGSFWVAPAEGDDGVTMLSLKGSPDWDDDLLSCDADPVTERHGLLNGAKKYGSYDADENILPRLPQTFRPEADSCISLVAAMQRNEEVTRPGGTKAIIGENADAYCVVTVMPQPPADGGINMIRPNITGATKEFLTWDDFDLERVPSHDFIKTRYNDKSWEEAKIRWSHATEVLSMRCEGPDRRGRFSSRSFSEGGRAFRAALLVHDYASGVATSFNSDVIALCDGRELEGERKAALAAMLAYGLDIYHNRYNHGENARKGWTSGAGQWAGQFMPPALAAALLRDPTKANIMRRTAALCFSSDFMERGPQELRQLHRGRSGVLLWGDGYPYMRPDNQSMVDADWRYWAGIVGSKAYDSYEGKHEAKLNQGSKTVADPYGYIDGPSNQPGYAYMSIAIGTVRSFASIMILMPDVRRVVNTDAPIEFSDRIQRHGLWTLPDPVAAPVKEDQDTASAWHTTKGAPGWGKTWGPNLEDVRFAIEGGSGRFPRLHGTTARSVYESNIARGHWSQIIALYDGEKFEDYQVGLDQTVAPEIFVVPVSDTEADIYLRCATPDAEIRYTTDGSEPDDKSLLYGDQPFRAPIDAVVRSTAFSTRLKASRSARKIVQ